MSTKSIFILLFTVLLTASFTEKKQDELQTIFSYSFHTVGSGSQITTTPTKPLKTVFSLSESKRTVTLINTHISEYNITSGPTLHKLIDGGYPYYKYDCINEKGGTVVIQVVYSKDMSIINDLWVGEDDRITIYTKSIKN